MVVKVIAYYRHVRSGDYWKAWWKLPHWGSAFSWKRAHRWESGWDDYKVVDFRTKTGASEALVANVKDYFKKKLRREDSHEMLSIEVEE